MCVCQHLEKGKEQLFWGSELCIFLKNFFFQNKLLHLHPSKCWTKATYRKLLLKLQRLSFTDFAWLSFLSFWEGKMSLHKVVGCQATPKLLSPQKAACRGSQAEPVHELRQKRVAYPISYGRTDVLKTYFWTQEIKIWF